MTSFSTLQASGRAVRLARPAQERDHQRLQAKVYRGTDEEQGSASGVAYTRYDETRVTEGISSAGA